EKLVLAISGDVTILTTKGGIRFDTDGRHSLRERQPVGSRIECLLRMTLYELGIPVVVTGDKWHYDIGQKVPLTLDRENVQPNFLRQVRVVVFNRMSGQLAPEDVNSEWAETAIASPDCAPEAVQSCLSTRFG